VGAKKETNKGVVHHKKKKKKKEKESAAARLTAIIKGKTHLTPSPVASN